MATVSPQVLGVQHREVDAAGLRMHVVEAGPPDGEPVLVLHGWPQHWYQWRHQIPALADAGYRVIVPDLRGFGQSDAPPHGYDKESMATDVLNLMDAMGLERVKLLAHDWGGWIAFILCVRAPERFSRHVALNIPHLWAKTDPRTLLSIWRFWYQAVIASPWLGAWILRNRPEFVRRIIQGSSPNPQSWTDEDIDAFVKPLQEPARANASVQLYRTFLTREMGPVAAGRYQKKRLTVPTKLLFGEDDFAIPKSFFRRDPGEFADDFTIEFVPDTGHFIAEERPELVNDRALEFFARD
ncbi:MAG: alpha/beta fold hydrolase [Solirubrobacterales bacterium]